MVRVGGGWVTLDEFLETNDPCRGRSNNTLITIRLIFYYDYLPFCTTNNKIKKNIFWLTLTISFDISIYTCILLWFPHLYYIHCAPCKKTKKPLWSLLLINVGRGEVSQPRCGCPLFLSSFQCIMSLIYQDTLCTFIAPIVSKGIESPLITGILQYGNGVWVNAF